MFGEKEIVGQTIIRVKKDRIKLPDFTGVEPGETLSATLDPHKTKIIILKTEEFEEKLDELAKKMKQARQLGHITYKQYHELQLYIWGILPLHDRLINKNKEFLLYSQKHEDQPEQAQIRKLNLKDEVFAVGVDHHLEIYPNEEAYILSKKQK